MNLLEEMEESINELKKESLHLRFKWKLKLARLREELDQHKSQYKSYVGLGSMDCETEAEHELMVIRCLEKQIKIVKEMILDLT